MTANADLSLPARGALSIWFTRSKRFWFLGLLGQVAVATTAGVTAVTGLISGPIAVLLGVVSVVAPVLLWRADTLRQRADTLLRQVELEDGFGWPIDRKLLSDNLVMAIPLGEKAKARAEEQGTFYASSRDAGPARALDNLRESAWWTQHLSSSMAWITGAAAASLFILALWGLLAGFTVAASQDITKLSNVLVAILGLVVTTDLLRLPVEYKALSRCACECDRLATALLRAPTPTADEAFRLVADYQLNRALAPQLPDWVWRLRRKRLNEIWNSTRSQSEDLHESAQ